MTYKKVAISYLFTDLVFRKVVKVLDPRVEVHTTEETGKGLFATQAIAKGETVWWEDPTEVVYLFAWHDKKLLHREAHLMWWDQSRSVYVYSMTDKGYLMNHSCDPTVGWQGETRLVAMRDLAPGEQITYDYATTEIVPDPIDPLVPKCLCGVPNCRGQVRPDDLLQYPELRARYEGYLKPSVEQWVSQQLIGE